MSTSNPMTPLRLWGKEWLEAAALEDFECLYAQMRTVDDQVDGFLEELGGRTPDLADQKAALVLANSLPRDLPERLAQDAANRDIWRRFRRAMHRDLELRPIEDWQEFLDYCDGATVAPAEFFVLSMIRSTGRALPARDQHRLRAAAASLGLYCYGAHILRDLQEDAEASPLLVHLPRRLVRHFFDAENTFFQALKLPPTGALEELRENFARRFVSAREAFLGAAAEVHSLEAKDILEKLSLFELHYTQHYPTGPSGGRRRRAAG